MAVRFLMIITSSIFLVANGCNSEQAVNIPAFPDSPTVIRNDAPQDELVAVSSEPPLPATLVVGDKLNFNIVYELKSLNRAAIWVRPFVNGRKAVGYNAHHIVGVTKESENPGVVTGWFLFNQPAQVNEIRVYMRDLETGRVVKEISYQINATWANP